MADENGLGNINVVVGMNVSGVHDAIINLSQKYPNAKIVVLADNDSKVKEEVSVKTGLIKVTPSNASILDIRKFKENKVLVNGKALNLAERISIIYPPNAGEDFNDIALNNGEMPAVLDNKSMNDLFIQVDRDELFKKREFEIKGNKNLDINAKNIELQALKEDYLKQGKEDLAGEEAVIELEDDKEKVQELSLDEKIKNAVKNSLIKDLNDNNIKTVADVEKFNINKIVTFITERFFEPNSKTSKVKEELLSKGDSITIKDIEGFIRFIDSTNTYLQSINGTNSQTIRDYEIFYNNLQYMMQEMEAQRDYVENFSFNFDKNNYLYQSYRVIKDDPEVELHIKQPIYNTQPVLKSMEEKDVTMEAEAENEERQLRDETEFQFDNNLESEEEFFDDFEGFKENEFVSEVFTSRLDEQAQAELENAVFGNPVSETIEVLPPTEETQEEIKQVTMDINERFLEESLNDEHYWNQKADELSVKVSNTSDKDGLYRILFYRDALDSLKQSKRPPLENIESLSQEIREFEKTLSEETIALADEITQDFFNNDIVFKALLLDADTIILKKDKKNIRTKRDNYFKRVVLKNEKGVESELPKSALAMLEHEDLKTVSSLQSRTESKRTTLADLSNLMDGYEQDVLLAIQSYRDDINTVQSLIETELDENGNNKRVSFFDYQAKKMKEASDIQAKREELGEKLKEKYSDDNSNLKSIVDDLIDSANITKKQLEEGNAEKGGKVKDLEENKENKNYANYQKENAKIADLELLHAEMNLAEALKADDIESTEETKKKIADMFKVYNNKLAVNESFKDIDIEHSNKDVPKVEEDIYSFIADDLTAQSQVYIASLIEAQKKGHTVNSMDSETLIQLQENLTSEDFRLYMKGNNDFRLKIEALVTNINTEISKYINTDAIKKTDPMLLDVSTNQTALEAEFNMFNQQKETTLKEQFSWMSYALSPQSIARQLDGVGGIVNGKVQIGPMTRMVNKIFEAEARLANVQDNFTAGILQENDRMAKRYGVSTSTASFIDKSGKNTLFNTSDNIDGEMTSYILAGTTQEEMFASDKSLYNDKKEAKILTREQLNRNAFLKEIQGNKINQDYTQSTFAMFVENGSKEEFYKNNGYVLANQNKNISDSQEVLDNPKSTEKQKKNARKSIQIAQNAITKFNKYNAQMADFDESIERADVDYSKNEVKLEFGSMIELDFDEMFKKGNYLADYKEGLKNNKGFLVENSQGVIEFADKIRDFHLAKIESDFNKAKEDGEFDLDKETKKRDKAIAKIEEFHKVLTKPAKNGELNLGQYYLNIAKTHYLTSIDMQVNTSREGEIRKIQMEIKLIERRIEELMRKREGDKQVEYLKIKEELEAKIENHKSKLKEYTSSGRMFEKSKAVWGSDKNFFNLLRSQTVKRFESSILTPQVVEFQMMLDKLKTTNIDAKKIDDLQRWIALSVMQVKNPVGTIKENNYLANHPAIPVTLERIADKLNEMRVYSRLVNNIGWSLFTQPLSMLITMQRYGIITTSTSMLSYLHQAYKQNLSQRGIFKAMGLDIPESQKLLMSESLANTMNTRFDVFTAKQHKNLWDLGADEQAVSKQDAMMVYDSVSSTSHEREINRTKKAMFNNFFSGLSNAFESAFDQISVIASLKKLESKGVDLSLLSKEEVQIIAQEAVSSTQSVYNQYNRPQILNNKLLRAIAPHQTYFMTVMNNVSDVVNDNYPELDIG